MPAIDLSILNQRQTPAFYADTLANRPSAGFIGRIFVSTNTFEFYRDNGTTWDLIGGPGTSTVTGTGANGQVTYWNGASSITGSNDLFWDSVNGHLGIGTNLPGTALQIDHDQNQFIRLNQTTATNDTKIAFQNSGVALWRIGNSYNAGANDFGIYDVVGAIQPVTVKKTTGQVLIGTSTVGSGKLVVASATGDNGVQIVGASAPSLRIDNAESGPTKRAGFGISTATNNFIQGSADRDFCMFNGSTTASPILFGIYGTTNVQEAARISAARNFLIGTTTDNGNKIQVNGKGYINDTLILDGTNTGQYLNFYNSGVDRAHIYWQESLNNLSIGTYVAGGSIQFEVGNNVDAMFLYSSGNLGINTTSDLGYKLYVNGTGYFSSNLSSAGLIRLEPSAFGSIVVGSRSSQTDFQIYNTTNQFRIYNGTLDALTINTGNGNSQFNASLSALSIGVGNNISGFGDIMLISSNSVSLYPRINRTSTSFEGGWKYSTGGVDNWYIGLRSTDGVNSYHFYSYNTATSVAQFTNSGNLLIGTTTDNGNKLQVNGSGSFSGQGFFGGATNIDNNLKVQLTTNGSGTATYLGVNKNNNYGLVIGYSEAVGAVGSYIRNISTDPMFFVVNNTTTALTIKSSGVLNVAGIPTSAVGLVSGDIYSNAGILTIVP